MTLAGIRWLAGIAAVLIVGEVAVQATALPNATPAQLEILRFVWPIVSFLVVFLLGGVLYFLRDLKQTLVTRLDRMASKVEGHTDQIHQLDNRTTRLEVTAHPPFVATPPEGMPSRRLVDSVNALIGRVETMTETLASLQAQQDATAAKVRAMAADRHRAEAAEDHRNMNSA